MIMAKPAHLEPSKLGTKEYWDALYTTEITNHAHDPLDTGTAWFDDSDAETKLLEFLDEPERAQELGLDTATTSFLDLGTGNGALLFALRDAGWVGPMLGVDYSAQSVRFARRIERARRREGKERGGGDGSKKGDAEEEGDTAKNNEGKADEHEEDDDEEDDDEEDDDDDDEDEDVHFAEHDIFHTPATALLHARFSPSIVEGWDVILDKGTFDAISLSAETLDGADNADDTNTPPATDDTGTRPRRINEAYGTRILPLIREGGLFLITSCNWTETELRSWFEGDGTLQETPAASEDQEPVYWGFKIVGRVEYRSFSFGGVKGQTISSLCFQKVRKSR
ncbi:hypothetical protein E0Z10_g4367 [Xylaria hypoxylon]|uniref:Protein-lysine N-methyltransferase EFM4 n=1 Tax=Xylaria hypoxylon TaxID=37992 RepID=A0A4Z0Z0X4_9PEZI|nr:hypothetical protein E0Z10_g4367 [Xylaria hypoxylon]